MYHIRKAGEQDFQQIVALFQEFALFEKLPEKMTNSVEQMLQEEEYFHCYVAVNEENEILAYVTYFFAYYTWIGKSLYMDDLYVRPEYRGKQIGTSLINTLIALAKEEKCHKMRWQVSGWNDPAIAFYKSLGATVDDVENNCDLVF